MNELKILQQIAVVTVGVANDDSIFASLEGIGIVHCGERSSLIGRGIGLYEAVRDLLINFQSNSPHCQSDSHYFIVHQLNSLNDNPSYLITKEKLP